MTIKNTLRNIAGTTLTALAMAGCAGNLRMDTGECQGEYREGVGFPVSTHNQLTSKFGDTTLILLDYTKKTIDWNKDEAESNLREDSIDGIIIRTPNLSEMLVPSDSNSNTISGRRARDWLKRGNALYLRTRECFVDWARRDYQKTHAQP
jgi:hypothetical protein